MLLQTLIGLALALGLLLPLAWKWQLGVWRSAAVVTVAALAASAAVGAIATAVDLGLAARSAMVFALTSGLALLIVAYRFYRDPERTPPEDETAILSPADGEVVYVRRSESGMLPVATKHGHEFPLHELVRTPLRDSDATVIGISLSFLDVHVNRTPISGTVSAQSHFPGQFGSLRRPEMAFRNERATTVIERDDLQIAVVLIASRLVRQIVSFVERGQDVARGQRIGVIRLGSQVDLVVPERQDVRVLVAPGDRVVAGETIVARVGASAAAREHAEAEPQGLPASSRP